MTTQESEIVIVKRRLEGLRDDLERGLRCRDEITVQKYAEYLDQIQCAMDRDLAIRRLDRDGIMLREVNAALKRIDDGSFGRCFECQETIAPKRIAALPWTDLCLECSQLRDRARETLRAMGPAFRALDEQGRAGPNFSLTNLGVLRVFEEPS